MEWGHWTKRIASVFLVIVVVCVCYVFSFFFLAICLVIALLLLFVARPTAELRRDCVLLLLLLFVLFLAICEANGRAASRDVVIVCHFVGQQMVDKR